MLRRRLARLTTAVLVFASCLGALAAAASTPTYPDLLADADALVAEQSWEQAKLRYADALALAPDEAARARCELLIADAAWRSEATTPVRWRDMDGWQRRHLAAFDRLEAPYRDAASPRPHDDFWVDLLTRRLVLERFLDLTSAADQHFASLVEHLGAQAPSATAASRYIGFLQQFLAPSLRNNQPSVSPGQHSHLRLALTDGVRIATTADDRAWGLWQLARLPDVSTLAPIAAGDSLLLAREAAARWSAALAAAPNTRWAPQIRAEEFLWRVHSRYSPDLSANAPADLPALLAELAGVRSALGREAPPDLRNALDQLERSLTEPRLDVTILAVFAPGAPIRFSYGTSGLTRLEVALERTTPAGWLGAPAPRFPGDRRAAAAAHPNGRTSVREWTIPLSDPARLAWNAAVVEAAPSLPAGLYVLTVRGEKPSGSEPILWQRRFAVSSVRGLGVFSSTTTGRLFVYRPDGQPIAHTAVELFSAGPKPLTWSATTDAQGSVPLRVLDEQCREVVALVAGEPVGFENVASWHGPDHPLYFDVFTDRPLFRPGETAHWKLIARQRHDGRLTIPQNLSGLKFRIKLRDDDLVAPTPLTLSATGSLHGEIQIPATASAGEVTLQIMRGTDANQPIEHAVSLFQVDRYVAPAATAGVAFVSDARTFRPGRTITARVTANYFSGGPLVGAPVQVTFNASDFAHDGSHERFAKWTESLAREPRSAVTDAHGAAEVTLTLPDFLPEGTTLRVAATVTPDGTPALNADASVAISASGLTLDPLGWTSPRLAAPQESVSFAAVIRDGRGTPVSLAARAKLAELRWSEVWLDAHGNPIPPEELAAALAKSGPRRPPCDGARLVHAGYTETIVAETDVRTAADGRLAAEFALPRPGLFRLRVYAEDEEILTTPVHDYSRSLVFASARSDRNPEPTDDVRRDPLSIVALDEHTTALALNPETAALITPPEIAPDQPLRVLAVTPAGVGQAWLSLVGEKDLAVEPLDLTGRLALHRFAAPPTLFGRAGLELLCRTEPGTPQPRTAVTLPVNHTPNQLRVALVPAAENSRPGQTVEVTARATDSTGQPAVGAELAVRVADDAVVSLLSPDDAAASPSYLQLSAMAANNEVWSTSDTSILRAPLDPRPGAIRNPAGVIDEDGELIVLSPFAVESAGDSYGYAANATLAGARVRTSLKDIASDISVVTPQQFLGAPPITLRSHFASTAFWSPDLITDARGEARLTVTYPDNLTRWRLGAYALGADGNTFGTAAAFTQTSLPFQARLQLPRFLIAGDTASPSATLVNRTDADLRATATFAFTGPLAAIGETQLTRADLLVPQQAESHTAWPLRATAPGTAELKLTARAGSESDAMSLPLPILEDGIQQHTAAFARLAPDAARTDFTLELPAPLDPARTQVSVQLSPGYATTLLDALPYLVDFPYGCVEQTMSRFLPAVVVHKTLTDLGLDADAVERRILARESAANKTRREHSAGFAHLDDVVAQSLSRLREAQTSQGFGWWPGANSPDLWMTAYVAWGLALAADAGIEVPDDLSEQTTRALANLIQQNESPDDRLAFAWAALARTKHRALVPSDAPARFTKIFAARDRLSASGRACLALAANAFATDDQSAILLRNLDNGVQRSTAAGLGDTAHWGAAHNYWRAMDSAVESTALTLLALLELDPTSKLIDPAATWLALNRRSAHWSSTRDTAFAVLALNQFLRSRGQLDGTAELELLANNRPLRRLTLSRATLLEPDNLIPVPLTALRAGNNTFTLRRVSGAAPVLTAALSSSWARGDAVKPLGHLIDVARVFDRQKAEPTLIGTLRLTAEPLTSGHAALAGDEVTARLTLTIPNELEYVMIAVPKPAGCEPLNPLSGWDARLVRIDDAASSSAVSARARTTAPGDAPPDDRPLYREERDDRSVFFLDHIEAGTWELRFGLRAVTPGDFRALPATAEAMYAPEITANSDARRVQIEPAH